MPAGYPPCGGTGCCPRIPSDRSPATGWMGCSPGPRCSSRKATPPPYAASGIWATTIRRTVGLPSGPRYLRGQRPLPQAPSFIYTTAARNRYRGSRRTRSAIFAIDFLSQQKNGHNFALLMPFYAPHTPYDFTPDSYHDPYRDSKFPDFPDLPAHAAQNPQLQAMHGNRSAKLRIRLAGHGRRCQHRPRDPASQQTRSTGRYRGHLFGRPGMVRRTSWRVGQRQWHRPLQHVRGVDSCAADLESPARHPGGNARADEISLLRFFSPRCSTILEWMRRLRMRGAWGAVTRASCAARRPGSGPTVCSLNIPTCGPCTHTDPEICGAPGRVGPANSSTWRPIRRIR